MRAGRIVGPLLSALALVLFGAPQSSGQDYGEPLPENELRTLLGGAPPDQITWRVVRTMHSSSYHGSANSPLNGSVWFHVGFWQDDLPPGQAEVHSRLGRYRAKWQRHTAADGSIEQQANVDVGGILNAKARVWAKAPNEHELGRLLAALGRLPTFSSGTLPPHMQDFEKEAHLSLLIWICWSALVLAGAWFVDRVARHCGISAAHRLVIFAGVIAVSIAATIGIFFVAPPVVGDWLVIAQVFRLFRVASLVLLLSLLVASGLFLARLFRTGTIPTKPARNDS